jgi:serine/threonine protein kinase
VGEGGIGEVYRARDTRLGRDVALKVLPDALVDDPKRLHRFEQEARAAGRLNAWSGAASRWVWQPTRWCFL